MKDVVKDIVKDIVKFEFVVVIKVKKEIVVFFKVEVKDVVLEKKVKGVEEKKEVVVILVVVIFFKFKEFRVFDVNEFFVWFFVLLIDFLFVFYVDDVIV